MKRRTRATAPTATAIPELVPLTPEQQALVAKWIPYAVGHAKRLTWRNRIIRSIGISEAISAAMEGLVDAVRGHDAKRASYSTYAKWHILSAVQRAAEVLAAPCRVPRRCFDRKTETVEETLRAITALFRAPCPADTTAGRAVAGRAMLSDRDRPGIWEDRLEVLPRALAVLTEQERQCLDMLANGQGHRQIAQQLGLSRWVAIRLARRVRQVLRDEIERLRGAGEGAGEEVGNATPTTAKE